MAIVFPAIENIMNFPVKPEEGELHLLKYLQDHLDDSFEIFFNPFLNGDRPDIIVLRKNYGVLIIEVKDWVFEHYFLDAKRKWKLNQNNAYIKSPIDQVLRYKENLYNLHIENLLEKRIKNFKFWNIVHCAIYFHKESEDAIHDFLINPYEHDEKYQTFLSNNIEFIGRNNLNENDFNTILKKKYLIAKRENYFFDNDLYDSFKRYLQPTQHLKDQGIKFNYSQKQKELIVSESRDQRIKGVVGSGKTTVLAARAVNAHLRTKDKVLVLTFNITLKNYIHDKISKVRESFEWGNFYINNYHNFLTSEMNNLEIPIIIPEGFSSYTENEKSDFFETKYYSNIELFEDKRDKIHKYKTILIDEIQDYKRPWMEIIKTYFLAENGEYVLFGDEKQNIYDNALKYKDIDTNVIGRPSELKDCFRSDKKIKDLAVNFQKSHFENKYNIDDFNVGIQGALLFEKESRVSYYFVEHDKKIDAIFNLIMTVSKELNEHPNDIAVLGFTIKVLRKLDCYYRFKTGEKTNAMFEKQEIWFKLILDTYRDEIPIKEGMALFEYVQNNEDKEKYLATALTIKSLSDEFPEMTLSRQLNDLLNKYRISEQVFNEWYVKEELKVILNRPTNNKFHETIKNIRDNKKIHFWYNRGTLKLSTVHSFKGWEANTLILLLEPRYDSGDFKLSFDELIYVGLTRSKLNLVLINYGNLDYHDDLETLLTP
jgi:hypothetical protein